MATIAFWNIKGIKGRASPDVVAALAREQDADVVVLAECGQDAIGGMLEALNSSGAAWKLPRGAMSGRTTFLIRHPFEAEAVGFGHPRGTAVELRRRDAEGRSAMLIVGLHLEDARSASRDARNQMLGRVAAAVRRAERAAGHRRTIVIGDFNLHPFDPMMYSSEGMHALPHLASARRNVRKVRQRKRRMFYNPMWKLYANEPPGTFFRTKGDADQLFWNMVDQALVRPNLLGRSDAAPVMIADRMGSIALVGESGRMSKSAPSDHLPIVLRLNDD